MSVTWEYKVSTRRSDSFSEMRVRLGRQRDHHRFDSETLRWQPMSRLSCRVTSRSSQLLADAQKWIPGSVNSPVRAFRNVDSAPFFVDRARRSKMWDVDGNEYIDYVGSWGPTILGHAPEIVVNAVRETA